jgi:hypothetical protein
VWHLLIETLLDVFTLSIEEVIGRLKTTEEDTVESSIAEGKLLLIEEEWAERSKKKEAADGSHAGPNSSDRGGRDWGGGNRGRGKGRGGRGDGSSPFGGHGNNNNCHRCGKPSHWAQDCRSKHPKKDKQVFTAQEEESTLLLTETVAIRLVDPVNAVGGDGHVSGGDVVVEVKPGGGSM